MHPDDTTITIRLCRCGCGQRTTIATKTRMKHGEIAGRYHDFVKGHNCRLGTITPQHPRFRVDPDTRCWIWLGGNDGHGYGTWTVKGRAYKAHRVMYERVKGPIPLGPNGKTLFLDHLCRNPSCINPDHLDPVSPAINIQRGKTAKITMEIARQIRASKGTGSNREIGERFGLHSSSVSLILRNKIWKE